MMESNIKTELIALIDQETDFHVLEAVKVLLEKTSSNQNLKAKLSARALRSEQNIKDGELMDREELENKLNARLNQ